MTKPLGSWISRIWLVATSVGLELLVLAMPSARAQTYTKMLLHEFIGGYDGQNPMTRLILDKSGNLYGTTYFGGQSNVGTIYKVDENGIETVLHMFDNPLLGYYPRCRLTMDAAGNLYGTTTSGGTAAWGTVFKLDTQGNYTVLHNFKGGLGGGYPFGGLLMVSDGYFVGSTVLGGAGRFGIVYRLAPKSGGGWKFTVLHAFSSSDGQGPEGELTRDAAGNLYGTTQQGGTFFRGTVFKIHSYKESILHSFMGGVSDGDSPNGTLLLDKSGNLYGTTTTGGNRGTGCVDRGCGTAFKIDAKGSETVIYAFKGGSGGASPGDRLVTDSAENLYGTTLYGGEETFGGTVYKLDPMGTLTVLHAFTGGKDGRVADGLAIDGAGNLFGTTQLGGISGCLGFKNSCGTVFKLTPQ
jgi:uncharacterized repeat protein (TIGR03803 family)